MDAVHRPANDNDTQSSARNTLLQEATTLDVVKAVEKNFGKIDSNNDKYITELELTNASRSRIISSDDKTLIGALVGTVSFVEELHDDEKFDENSGISLQDLQDLNKVAKTAYDTPGKVAAENLHLVNVIDSYLPSRNVHDKYAFGEVLWESFDAIDKDKSKSLSRDELDSFSKNAMNSSESREVARVLSEHFDDVAKIAEYRPNNGIVQTGFWGFNDGRKDNVISRRDADTLAKYVTRPYQYHLDVQQAKSENLLYGIPTIAGLAGVTTLGGISTVLAPSLTAKVVLGGTTAFYGAATIGTTKLVWNEFRTVDQPELLRRRQEMVNSWNFFR